MHCLSLSGLLIEVVCSEILVEDERIPFVLCHYTVFNVEQCDGLTLPEISQPAIAPEVDEDELCESIVTGWKSRPALYLNSPSEYRAYYRPSSSCRGVQVEGR